MSNKTKVFILLALAIVMLLGLGTMVYPFIAAKYADTVRSEVHAEYQTVVSEKDNRELDAVKQAAIAYNQKLYLKEIAVSTSEDVRNSGYWDQLRLEGNDVMCYIRIPAIDVELPVFHGIGEDALGIGCGHMPQTSLPIGGQNTHAVISAHTGMASSAMFSDLPLLQVGDIFYIDILGETLTYEIYEIPDPVLPHEISAIQIKTGQDLCTLVTCVPFGVNSHRLLVHGRRIETVQEPSDATTDAATVYSTDDTFSIYNSEYKNSVLLGVGIIAIAILMAITLAVIIVVRRKKLSSSESAVNQQ